MKHQIARSALVQHSAAQMYALVNDIDLYQEFLPWCGSSKVLSHDGNEMVASVEIAFKGIRKTFTTRNTLTEDTRIDLALVDGPFSELTGTWEFKPISDQACRISLNLGFGFSNKLVERLLGPVFKKIADSMVDSFCKRADEIYTEV